jgi:hypothetical protein
MLVIEIMWAIAGFVVIAVGTLWASYIWGDDSDKQAIAEIADTLLPRRD